MKSNATLNRVGICVIFIMNWSVFSDAEISCIATEGGNSGGANCVFPFKYRGRTYSDCTNVRKRNAWCVTTDNYSRDQKWGYCIIPTYGGTANGANCQFPFTHGTYPQIIEYKTCHPYGEIGQTWCKVGDGEKWGYCDMTCSRQATTTMKVSTPTATPILSTTTTMATAATPTPMTTQITTTTPMTTPTTTPMTTQATTPMATPAAIMITVTTLVVVIVSFVVIIMGVMSVVICVIMYRKKQRKASKRPTADTSAYYNVSAATRLHPHNTAPKIPRRNPHAESTASYEQIAVTGDYYNISQVKDGSKVGDTIYELPQRDGIEIAESSNAGDVYQPLDNAATGSDLQTTTVDYEHVDISSDYLTTLY